MWGMNRDWRRVVLKSDLWSSLLAPSLLSLSLGLGILVLELLMRKKFLNFWPNWVFEPGLCLPLEVEIPEAVRFSDDLRGGRSVEGP